MACVVLSANAVSGQGKLEYPKTAQVDQTDDYHGTQVPDPYRWLEDDVRTSAQVEEWVTAQNKVTFGYLEAIAQREPLRKRLTELWDYEKYGSPFKTGWTLLLLPQFGSAESIGVVHDELAQERTTRVD